MQQLRRIAIVNRSEAAMRLIHAVRELNAHGGDPIETIALFTESEPDAMFVREADHTYPLGPAAARPYLDHDVLERALRATRADAVWVGWGFVAEDPEFAEMCERIGVVFIGPTPEAMRQLGDKIGAKQLAEKVGVPVARWSGGGLADVSAALESAHRIGYPLMLKAAAGGGGRGIRKVTNDAELSEVFDRTRAEAQRAFGSDVVFLESLVTEARHVEVQLIADGQGTAWALGVRDCSVQRRNQKLIEESASPLLRPEQTQSIKDAAVRLALEVGYRGAGTVEFLYTSRTEEFAFLEVNTRLQVEHPVTELTTGVDLVALQLHVAAGGRLEGPAPTESGHAVEARLNAEDPDRDFAPAPGRISVLNLPTGPGLRIDTGVAEGDGIPSDFDSMIAKVIAYGTTREQALARLRRALEDTTVVVEGGTTNKSFLLSLLDQSEVTRGEPAWADTGWIDRERAAGGLAMPRHSGVALIAAGVAAYQQAESHERLRFLTTANGGRPQAQHDDTREFQLGLRGSTHAVVVAEVGPASYRVGLDGIQVEVGVERLGRYAHRLTVDGQAHRVVTANQAGAHVIEVDASLHRVTRDSGGVIASPAPALVVSVSVRLGDEVAAGDTVAVLESMKMETLIPAPYAGRVRDISVTAGDQVGAGGALLTLEPLDEDESVTEPGEIDLELPSSAVEVPSLVEQARSALTDVRHLLLGFDIPSEQGRELVAEYQRLEHEAGERLLDEELSVLAVFADLAELSRNRPSDGDTGDDRVHSPREFFHQYLHTLDADRQRLPEAFRDRLSRALAHYGVHDLTRSLALEEAVFRLFLAQQRANSHVPTVTALLEGWLTDPAPTAPDARSRTQDVLDRLVTATQLRHPTVGNLARSIRYRWFEVPLAVAASATAVADIRRRVEALDTAADDFSDQVESLTTCPEPLVAFVGERAAGLSDVPVAALLEIMARRHYREYTLDALTLKQVADRTVLAATYTLDERPTYLISMIGDVEELRTAESEPESPEPLVAAIAEAIAQAPQGHQVVVDLYLTWAQAPASETAVIEGVRQAWQALPFAGTVRRAAVTVYAGPDRTVRQFTLRPAQFGNPDPGGIIEDALVRGVHPMVGRRLELWRLRNFDITRLDAPEGVLLYRCVAPDNEADVRLVALAQIRELTIVRDSAGQVTSLPQAERVLSSCLDAIRWARAEVTSSRSGRRQVLDNNHVWLHIWPEITAPVEQLTAMRRTIAPLTQGAGLSEVTAQGVVRDSAGQPTPMTARFTYQPGTGVEVSIGPPPLHRLATMDEVDQKVLRARRRGTVYPYELIGMLTPSGGRFVEYDLNEPLTAVGTGATRQVGSLEPVDRPPGQNRAGLVVGVVSAPTDRHPEGMRRVVLIGDPTMALGAVAEPECARVVAALDLAERESLPVEWFTLSAGARIAMDSGTENMDWVARALRRIIEFTQGGGEINIVVTGINVGAQPYWNAEATMLMHTKGILVMTPDSAMVLTGKTSLDYSGGVSAEDNFGIGGYDRVMGPNGQAQYWAPDLAGAIKVLLTHYDHSYVAPGEQRTRATTTSDPVDRDVCAFPHPIGDSGFSTVGDIFSPVSNPERKKPFDIRTVLRAVSDSDHPTLERWAAMGDADTCVVLDAHLAGQPVTLLGIESKTVARRGFPPTDGPEVWTAGTLFPRSSKKAARAINAASGSRPVVVLANLSGFDGSPESMRRLQLEYGAEIGRAVTNFDGAIVFCVISRYHGGAFVVFSKALNDRMQVLAVEGSFASVIGGAPAAGVVFTGEVDARTSADPRVKALERYLANVSEEERAIQMGQLVELRAQVRSEKLREVATEFDTIHSIERAVEVGSVDAIVPAHRLRPELIAALNRGLAR